MAVLERDRSMPWSLQPDINPYSVSRDGSESPAHLRSGRSSSVKQLVVPSTVMLGLLILVLFGSLSALVLGTAESPSIRLAAFILGMLVNFPGGCLCLVAILAAGQFLSRSASGQVRLVVLIVWFVGCVPIWIISQGLLVFICMMRM